METTSSNHHSWESLNSHIEFKEWLTQTFSGKEFNEEEESLLIDIILRAKVSYVHERNAIQREHIARSAVERMKRAMDKAVDVVSDHSEKALDEVEKLKRKLDEKDTEGSID